ncbi:MAG: hypothetical protein ACRCSO_08705 [Sphingomonas sp.]
MQAAAARPIWLTSPSRFARLSPRTARWWAAAFALLLIASLSAVIAPGPPPASHDPASAASDRADVLLYQHVAAGVRGGGNYYAVAAAAQRREGYPVRPFVTMRLPTLALIQAWLPLPVTLALLWALAGGALYAWYVRLSAVLTRPAPRLIAVGLAVLGGMICTWPELAAFHEIWAGLLVALSLALWRPADWVPAAGVAACAMLIRETAAAYAITMAAMAWASGNRREAWGWGAALGLLAMAVVAHIYGWEHVVRPDDPTGPGWSALLGFGFFVKTVTLLTGLFVLPPVLGAALVGFAMIGWASWRDPLAVRVVAVIVVYALIVSLFCRPDTYYWSLMVAPVTLIGLVFAPDGLRDLWTSLRDRRRVIVTRTALKDGQ